MEAPSGQPAKQLPNPAQVELPLQDRQVRFAYAEAPWQIELMYRLSLDTATTVLAILCHWLVDFATERTLGHLDWSLSIVRWVFNVSVLVVVTVGVLWDLGAFVSRRIPHAWKQQILIWRSVK